jgi:proteic killer suppression protein
MVIPFHCERQQTDLAGGWQAPKVLDATYRLPIQEGGERLICDSKLQGPSDASGLWWTSPKGFPADIFPVARRKLGMLNAAPSLDGLRIPPANRLEALKGDRKGQHSIRINDQWRICFRWTSAGPEDVEIVDYH